MRFVTWNCQGAFRGKAHALATFAPDIAIIQECEALDRLHAARAYIPANDTLWFGDYAPKGLAILAYGEYTLELDSRYNSGIRHCVPIKVSGPSTFHLLAVWAMGHNNRRLSYIAQVHKAVEAYADFIREAPTLVAGDFNSNRQWDHIPRLANHSQVVANLGAAGLGSLYHEYTGQPQGSERQPTFFMNRNVERCFHIDYCFAPRAWLRRVKRVSVGAHRDWSSLSDHSPLFVEIAE